MRNNFYKLFVLMLLIDFGCNSDKQNNNTDKAFTGFEDRFLDAYWKQYPANSINVGYGKYYNNLVVPDSAYFAGVISFSNRWIDSLENMNLNSLGENNKISYQIIKNQLESDRWYTEKFRIQEWDASFYNISGSCDYIINQPWAPLTEKLRTLTAFLKSSGDYYRAGFANLHEPTREHLGLAIQQNQGGISLFGKALADSIGASQLTIAEKQQLQQRIDQTVVAMKGFISSLQSILSDKNFRFRDFRIGKQLFSEKFNYDLVTDLTPEQVYDKAVEAKHYYHRKMFTLSDSVWSKYYPSQPKPQDSFVLIQLVLNKVQLEHPKPADFYDTVSNQVHRLKKFIVEKDLFAFDTAATPIVVRYMPEYARGFSSANAQSIPPYQKEGTTYYNIDDLTQYPPDKAESALRSDNNYGSSILSIHEAVPGHCMQGIYNNLKSPDVLRSVFQNSAMIEGWAVYTEAMMVEQGWYDHTPGIELALGVWRLRELANVIIDYAIQVLGKPKDTITNFLTKECFQTSADVEEKYRRATLSQVQLCAYFAGSTAIQSLRDEYQKKKGDKYSLKDFHEQFLSYGSSPLKYIRERMLK